MSVSNLTDKDLEEWADQAKRDDWHFRFVGSDIRQLIGEIQRCRKALRGYLSDCDNEECERCIAARACFPESEFGYG